MGLGSPMQRFWRWYERNERLNLTVATFLFLWQLVHLVWLTTDVVVVRLFGTSPMLTSDIAELALAVVDYTEIPALITTSLVYINDIRKGRNVWGAVRNLLFLNSQWIHLFWITDEFVLETFDHAYQNAFAYLSPFWAWVAIGIDYLELPVMIDTTRRWFQSLGKR